MLISGSLHRKWLLTAHTSNRMAWMSFLSWTYTSFTFTIAIWILILYINYGYTSYVYVLHKPLCIKKKKGHWNYSFSVTILIFFFQIATESTNWLLSLQYFMTSLPRDCTTSGDIARPTKSLKLYFSYEVKFNFDLSPRKLIK